MFVVFRTHLQFHVLSAVVAFALELFRLMGIMLAGVHVHIAAVSAGVAFEHAAVFLQLILVIGDEFRRRVIGFIFDSHHLQAEAQGGEVDVGALFFPVLSFLLHPCSGINRKADVADVGALADVDAAKRSLDVHFLFLAAFVLSYIDTAGGQDEQGSGCCREGQ